MFKGMEYEIDIGGHVTEIGRMYSQIGRMYSHEYTGPIIKVDYNDYKQFFGHATPSAASAPLGKSVPPVEIVNDRSAKYRKLFWNKYLKDSKLPIT